MPLEIGQLSHEIAPSFDKNFMTVLLGCDPPRSGSFYKTRVEHVRVRKESPSAELSDMGCKENALGIYRTIKKTRRIARPRW